MSESKFAAIRGLKHPTTNSTSQNTPLNQCVPDSVSATRTGPYHNHASPNDSLHRLSETSPQACCKPPSNEFLASKEASEDDGLPLYRHDDRRKPSRSPLSVPHGVRRRLGGSPMKAGVLIVAGLIYVLNLLASTHTHFSGRWPGSSPPHWKSAKTNVILMISDGFGPAGETFARSFAAALNSSIPNVPYSTPKPLPLDDLLIGTHRSRSSSSLITDSAAGATAFSCALKSYNGAIGVDSEGRKCGTLFEAAKNQRGMLTGVVVTSRLTDATPAAFVSHAASRALEADIATQAVLGTLDDPKGRNGTSRVLDLAIGGGGCNFMHRDHPMSCRTDDVDLVADATALGWNVWAAWPLNWTRDARARRPSMTTHISYEDAVLAHVSAAQIPEIKVSARSRDVVAHIDSHKSALPFLGLLAPGNTPYEIDRIAIAEDQRPPSLKMLASKVLHMLDTDSSNKNGFILMIEGSQIDLCAHSNDGACHAREILAYQEAIATVRDFVDSKNAAGERTILISTSDHETGGLTLGRQLTAAYPNYAWYPERLLGAKQSAQMLSAELVGFATKQRRSSQDLAEYIRSQTLGEQGAGFTEQTGGLPTDEEVDSIAQCIASIPASQMMEDPPLDVRDVCRVVIANAMSRRAEIGWSTSGHTGLDVNVFGRGPGIDRLRGNIENTDIGSFIEAYLSLDLGKITKELA
ncbi:alkaline phosphatase-like protein [Tilletiaria anomala UBC 951]|uniref:Alkaline phosphatase n=1 Tax=Tilletiaria anomala (strain ATCC 24038 / CBS 436.72 / UBC 951) TaxID=1037660 RepID=A0A066WIP1_TILAU|nr:alkaline phosphatase-like protein [Tilletiaria anomala UBC 951]KDN52403.1 alkaline phosphatase-like protein [Tilletiaria anomala UBC 951]